MAARELILDFLGSRMLAGFVLLGIAAGWWFGGPWLLENLLQWNCLLAGLCMLGRPVGSVAIASLGLFLIVSGVIE